MQKHCQERPRNALGVAKVPKTGVKCISRLCQGTAKEGQGTMEAQKWRQFHVLEAFRGNAVWDNIILLTPHPKTKERRNGGQRAEATGLGEDLARPILRFIVVSSSKPHMIHMWPTSNANPIQMWSTSDPHLVRT